jgi:hypothetical protein
MDVIPKMKTAPASCHSIVIQTFQSRRDNGINVIFGKIEYAYDTIVSCIIPDEAKQFFRQSFYNIESSTFFTRTQTRMIVTKTVKIVIEVCILIVGIPIADSILIEKL